MYPENTEGTLDLMDTQNNPLEYEILYPKRRIPSCSILGPIVSPNKILLTGGSRVPGLYS